MHINFVDFSKAFQGDCVIRERLWNIMRQYGIPGILIRTFKALYNLSSSCVKEGGRNSSWFEVKSGVWQGFVMSGFIFVLIMEWVMQHTIDRRRKFVTSVPEDPDYADDVALISSKFTDFQEKTDADAISGKGSALSNCWGFVNGTVRPIARPGPSCSNRITLSNV